MGNVTSPQTREETTGQQSYHVTVPVVVGREFHAHKGTKRFRDGMRQFCLPHYAELKRRTPQPRKAITAFLDRVQDEYATRFRFYTAVKGDCDTEGKHQLNFVPVRDEGFIREKITHTLNEQYAQFVKNDVPSTVRSAAASHSVATAASDEEAAILASLRELETEKLLLLTRLKAIRSSADSSSSPVVSISSLSVLKKPLSSPESTRKRKSDPSLRPSVTPSPMKKSYSFVKSGPGSTPPIPDSKVRHGGKEEALRRNLEEKEQTLNRRYPNGGARYRNERGTISRRLRSLDATEVMCPPQIQKTDSAPPVKDNRIHFFVSEEGSDNLERRSMEPPIPPHQSPPDLSEEDLAILLKLNPALDVQKLGEIDRQVREGPGTYSFDAVMYKVLSTDIDEKGEATHR